MPEKYKVPESKKIRVIIDTDAACEADDQYAIAHALMTQKFIIRGITAEHFGVEGSEQQSYDEVKKVLRLAKHEEVPVYHGSLQALECENTPAKTEATDFICREALSDSDLPLFVFCQGAVTNVASALIKVPEIASRMTIISIIGAEYPDGGHEFNLCNDYKAANVLFSSGVELWQVPMNCYFRMRVSYAELQEKVRPCGEIGRYLFDEMQEYANSEKGGWTMGESWTLGDSPVVGLGMDPYIGSFEERNSPVCNEDGKYLRFNDNKIRVYKDIDSRFILEDMFSKLKIFYSDKF